MKIVLSGVEHVFDCGQDGVCSVVIENPELFYEIVSDIERQIDGIEGRSVLSDNNKVIRMDRYAEQIMQFVPFDMNKKALLNKILFEMQKRAIEDDFFVQTNELLAAWEKLCINLEFEMPVNLNFTKINVESLIKASGIMVENEYDSLATKIIDYIELVERFEGKKLFIFINVRSFIGDDEMQRFVDTVLERNYQVLLLENMQHKLLNREKRYLIDADLCEICYNENEPDV